MTGKWSKTTKRVVIIAAAIVLAMVIVGVVLFVDFDRDDLPNYRELSLGTGILTADSDNDGLNDGSEVDTYQTDPLVADTDNDSLQDGLEVNTYQTNPSNPDTDSDGLLDGEEVAIWGTDPLSPSPQPLVTVVPNKTGTSAILVFETEDSISCRVRYGTDTNYGEEISEVRAGTQHLLILPGLTPNLEYRFTIGASYNGGDIYSAERTFASRNAVNNWDNELGSYTVNLFVYFNFDASQDDFDTWESYLREAARWIYDATDGYIRVGTVVMADSPSGDFAGFDNVADMKIGFFPGRGGYNATGGGYYAIGSPNIFMELGIYGDYYGNDWTGPADTSWPPPVITHEFCHYALGLPDEYYYVGDSAVYFCTNNTYDSSLMSSLGYWPGWYWTGTAFALLPFEYYSELCMDSTHTPGTNWEGTYVGDSMWRTLDSFYPNIPDDYYVGSATPVQDVGPGWGDALSFIVVNF